MEVLHIEKFDLSALSDEEMTDLGGGYAWVTWAIEYFLFESATNPTASAAALRRGFEAAVN